MATWERFKGALLRTRQALALNRRDGTVAYWEDALLSADLGFEQASTIAARVGRLSATAQLAALRRELVELAGAAHGIDLTARPAVVVMVGVNGSGKTSTAGKLACRWSADGRRVVLAAADTFRAAASEQLKVWAEAAGAELVAQKSGADPGAVAFDGLQRARARGADVLVVDTAGRLHTRQPLMDELEKVVRVLTRELGRGPDEVLLVLDGTMGQNAVAQAQEFCLRLPVTGLVVTKLDASARGGAVLAARHAVGRPVSLVGCGEQIEDLIDFVPDAYVDALLAGLTTA
ncbi:MAG: signal recognition particle-docking protein FtsY [Sulfobacillus sp.]